MTLDAAKCLYFKNIINKKELDLRHAYVYCTPPHSRLGALRTYTRLLENNYKERIKQFSRDAKLLKQYYAQSEVA